MKNCLRSQDLGIKLTRNCLVKFYHPLIRKCTATFLIGFGISFLSSNAHVFDLFLYLSITALTLYLSFFSFFVQNHPLVVFFFVWPKLDHWFMLQVDHMYEKKKWIASMWVSMIICIPLHSSCFRSEWKKWDFHLIYYGMWSI